MITIIIITALVSALITLVVGYFIWSGISVHKLKKQVKDNVQNILGQEEYTNSVDKRLDDKINDVYLSINQNSDDANQLNDEIHRELDKRFDKVYQIIGKSKAE